MSLLSSWQGIKGVSSLSVGKGYAVTVTMTGLLSSSENIVRFRFSEIPCAMTTFIISNFFSCDAKGPFPDLKNHKVEFLKGLRDCKVYEKYKGSRIALLRYSQSCHDFALKKQTKPQSEYNKNEN